MQAYQTLTLLPSGMSDAYVITAKSLADAYRSADALSVIYGVKVIITGVAA